MKTIRVYGRLAKELGQRIFRAEVETVGEAVRFLVANFPHIEQHIANDSYRIKAGKHIIDSDEIHYPLGSSEDISIIPVVVGAGAIGKIIVGALLIVASFFLAGVFLLGIAIAPIVFSVGASLVLGGVAQLLTPTPKTPAENKDARVESFAFSGIQNTSRSGVPIPIVYGETVVGSIVISAGITVNPI
jgi:predicted phage tail protein